MNKQITLEELEGRTDKGISNFIYANNQNQEELINPDFIKRLDEKGILLPLNQPIDQKKELTMYWQSKIRLVGFIVFICAFVLFSILLNETKMLNQIYSSVLTFWNALMTTINGL